jgi:cytoskeletal protein RodZ
MVTLQEIKFAKQSGRLIRKAREQQGHKLVVLASACSLSLGQLVAIEDGNFYAFHNDQNAFNHASHLYAHQLGLDLDRMGSDFTASIDPLADIDSDTFIPHFLMAKA